MLVNPANVAQAATERATVQDAAHALGARLMILDASSPRDIESTFEVLVGQRVGGLVVSDEIFFLSQRDRLVELAVPMQCQPYTRTASFLSPAIL